MKRIIIFSVFALLLLQGVIVGLYGAELLPVEVVEESENGKTSRSTQFWQIEIKDGVATCISVVQQRVPDQDYAEAFLFTSEKIERFSDNEFKITFPTPTGERVLTVKMDQDTVLELKGFSISKSSLSNKIIRKTFKMSSQKNHVIKINLPTS